MSVHGTVPRTQGVCRLALVCLLAAIGGCSPYEPPVAGDRGSDKYKADLEACQTSVGHDVYIRNANDIGTWMLSPVTGPFQRRAGIRSCMTGKGYVVTTAG